MPLAIRDHRQTVSLDSPRDGQCTRARPLQHVLQLIVVLLLELQMLEPPPNASSPAGVQAFVVAPPSPLRASLDCVTAGSSPASDVAHPAVGPAAANRMTANDQLDSRSFIGSNRTLALDGPHGNGCRVLPHRCCVQGAPSARRSRRACPVVASRPWDERRPADARAALGLCVHVRVLRARPDVRREEGPRSWLTASRRRALLPRARVPC